MSNFSQNQTMVVLTMDNLREIMYDCFLKAKAELSQPQEKKVKMLTTNEVCKLLHVDKSTLWRWAKDGFLVPEKIGRKNLYHETDVLSFNK